MEGEFTDRGPVAYPNLAVGTPGKAFSIAAATTALGEFPGCLSPDAIEDEKVSIIAARALSSADGARAFAVAKDISLIAAILSLVGAPETWKPYLRAASIPAKTAFTTGVTGSPLVVGTLG